MLKRLRRCREITFFQLAVLFLSKKHIVEDDVAPINATHLSVLAAFAFLSQGFQPSVEIPMRLENHTEVFRATLEEELQGRHPVQKNTIEDDTMHTLLGQVLHQQRKVVPEIQIGLARRVLRQGATTNVIDL